MYYEDPDKNIVELFYDKGLTEEPACGVLCGGRPLHSGGTAFDPHDLLKELRDGKAVADLIAWVPTGRVTSRLCM